MIPTRMANCWRWNSCSLAVVPLVTPANAGIIYEDIVVNGKTRKYKAYLREEGHTF
jgi:hypothetical protein